MIEQPLTVVYRCSDGRDFPVQWSSPDDARQAWYWDPEHNHVPCTPLDQAIWTECGRGAGQARAECGFAETDVFIGGKAFRYVNGFSYWHHSEPSADERAKAEMTNARLRIEYGGISSLWQKWCLPRAQRAVDDLKKAPVAQPVSELIDLFGYGFEQTFLMWGMEQDGLREFLKAELGDEGERTAIELTRGFPTATLEADQALWEVAQNARSEPRLERLIRQGVTDMARLRQASGGGFTDAFERYLDRYGWRTIDWDPSSPSLRERPEVPLQVVRRTLLEGLPPPAEAVAAAAAAREALAAEVETRFEGDTEKLAAFRERLQRESGYLGVKEGRALWQLSIGGALRFALLAKGRPLVAAGAIDEAEDVFYLLPGEIDALAASDSGASNSPAASDIPARDLVRRRRAERERFLDCSPPAAIGGEASIEADPAPSVELRGTGASRGVVTGTARVLKRFEDYDRLRAGEILVCPMTTPAWTPLFAVAAAVVSEGGGMLSHTAIAAREYGIPAVVGARDSTRLIPDGATVTVDGGAGVVTVDE